MMAALSGHEYKPVRFFVEAEIAFVSGYVPAHFAGKDDLVKALLDAKRKDVSKLCYGIPYKVGI
jgi:hypothetical protein